MTERKARIDLTNLPLRPRQLKHEELQNVFGGCMGHGEVCVYDSDCCPQFYCNHLIPFLCMNRW
jgi:hypothetical protein